MWYNSTESNNFHQGDINYSLPPTEIKQTLDAVSKYVINDNGRTEHHINQYILKEEIGRGGFGAVHLATDQHKTEYAIKEFSKSRLRKIAQSSNIKKQHHYRQWPGLGTVHNGISIGPDLPYSIHNFHKAQKLENPFYLIKGELDILKRLNHPNIVKLIEVLDDPEEDSLYMVLEICKKGVVMSVGIGEKAKPNNDECCRKWFRDMISGVAYLHEQGVVHRDIKPDNLLLTEDNILKVVDFGVSEIFEKGSDMMISKSAGSPAFSPPELCIVKHGYVCGKAADIWSLGVSLYCLRFGHLPFECSVILDLFESIRNEDLKLDLEPNQESEFRDLMTRILEKDPRKRIKMEEIMVHPWVTKNGNDPIPSKITRTEESDPFEFKDSFDDRLDFPVPMGKSEKEHTSVISGPVSFEINQPFYIEYNIATNDEQASYETSEFRHFLESTGQKPLKQRVDSGIELDESIEFNLAEGPGLGMSHIDPIL